MSERVVGNWIDKYLEYTDHTEPCLLYREWTAVTVIAACLQRKVYLNWGQDLYPNLYVVLIGPSGARKGTAMHYGRYFLDELKIKVAADSITREALIKTIEEATTNITDIENPNFTGEFDSSLTVYSPELSVLLGYDNKQLMTDMTDWYDCGKRWEYRTKNKGVNTIYGMWVNILGATTPDILQKTLPYDAIGIGLTARMMFVYAPGKGKLVPNPFLTKADENLRYNLLSDLEKIKMLRGQYKITEDFLENWVKWYPEQDRFHPFKDYRFDGYFERRPWTTLKLSLIMNAARTGDMIITLDDFKRALDLVERTEVQMTRTFSGVGKRDDADIMSKVMAAIGIYKGTGVTFNDLLKSFYHDIDVDGLTKILMTLEKIGYCNIVEKDKPKRTVIMYKEEE